MQNDPEPTTQERAAAEDLHRQKGEFKETLHSCGERLKDAIEYRARDLGESALHSVASSINAYGAAFQRAAESLEEQHQENAAEFAKQVSHNLEDTAASFENASTEEAVEYANEQIRLRPMFALGCAFSVGLAISRLLAVDQSRKERGYETGD